MITVDTSWIGWALALAVAVPVLLVVLTEVLRALTRRGRPAAKPVRLLRNWVVPSAALLVLVAFASQSPADQVWVRVVATILGFLLILLLSSLNVALFTNASDDSWRSRLPSIFVDLARLLLVVIGVAVLFQWVWGADVGGLVAALGVTSIVIGLALQNAVGGVISGLLLLVEQPFQLGDTLDAGGVQGRVVEVNWRAVHIDTGAGIQIVPNASLAGSSFLHLSRPPGAHHAPVQVAFGTDDPPHEVLALLIDVAAGLPWRAPGDDPAATYLGGGKYEVSLPLLGPADVHEATSLYLGWLWRAARRRGLALDNDATDPIAEGGRLGDAVAVVGDTLQLDGDQRAILGEQSRLERYGAGEILQRLETVPNRLRFVVSGRLELRTSVGHGGGGRVFVSWVDRGDYIGQTALTREPAIAEAVADGVVTVLSLPVATLESFLVAKPTLASVIGRSIEARRARVAQAVAQSTSLDTGGPGR